MKVGEVYRLKQGGSCTLVGYKNSYTAIVEFNDNHMHRKECRTYHLEEGSVKNPYHPRVYGVGFVGVGSFKTSIGGKGTEAYSAWSSMMRRCYDSKYWIKNPSYEGCTVHLDWHNFQNFAGWYMSQKWLGLGYQLDKDILVSGNKVYSKENCCLVPQEINKSISVYRKSGKLLGVAALGSKHRATIAFKGRTIHLGCFDTEEDAVDAYINAKTRNIKELAEEYRGMVDYKVYQKLSKYIF